MAMGTRINITIKVGFDRDAFEWAMQSSRDLLDKLVEMSSITTEPTEDSSVEDATSSDSGENSKPPTNDWGLQL